MAAIYTNGILDLKGRDAHFKNGHPVNNPQWDFFKRKVDLLSSGYSVTITEQFVAETFNPVLCNWSMRTLHSSVDRLKIWCMENGFKMTDCPKDRTITIVKE